MPNTKLASRFKPDDNGGNDDHRPVVDRTLLVARGESTPLLEPIDTALDYIATRVDRLVEGERTTRPSRPPSALIPALGDHVRDLPRAQKTTTARVAVPFVGDEPIRTGPGPSTSTVSRDMDPLQYRFQLRTIVPLPWCDHDREWPPFPVAGQMKLGGQPSAAASKPFVDRVLDPLFTSAWLG